VQSLRDQKEEPEHQKSRWSVPATVFHYELVPPKQEVILFVFKL